MTALYNRFLYISSFIIVSILCNLALFSDILLSKSNSICLFDGYTLSINKNSMILVKLSYLALSVVTTIFLSKVLSNNLIVQNNNPKTQAITKKNSSFDIKIGNSIETNEEIIIPEKGLYQNLLITGTIGTGKTSSAMYPILYQLLSLNIGMLILDVKGNFYKKVLELNKEFCRDVIIIEINGKYKYNPLDKPNLKASVLANRLRTILTLFSNQQVTDTYWLDKVEIYLTECIKLCRLYNDNYVTFIELHKLINNYDYLKEKLSIVKQKFINNELTSSQIFDFNTLLDFFQSEYLSLDSKVLSIIQSEISRITQLFISDKDVSSTFCPPKNTNNFTNFNLNSNQVVVLNMNVAEYRNLSKVIATYLKLDFQSSVLMRLSKDSNFSPLAFLCDEYHEYVTENDADFYAQSREAKCISIVSTQSYTSLLKTLKDPQTTKVIVQNLVNKIWFRNDDIFTIEEAQKQLGKEDKTKLIRSISENAKETKYSYILKTFKSDNSSLSESLTTNIYHDYIYDINSFSRELKTFQAICFISNGKEILKPQKIILSPDISIYQKNNKYI